MLNEIVKRDTKNTLQLESEKLQLEQVYKEIKNKVRQIDTTLLQHTEALETKALKTYYTSRKKILRAEKRKFEDSENQLSKILHSLFLTVISRNARKLHALLFKMGECFFRNSL